MKFFFYLIDKSEPTLLSSEILRFELRNCDRLFVVRDLPPRRILLVICLQCYFLAVLNKI